MDFFTALVDRAWERIPVLQRRRASLFEPVQVEDFEPRWAPTESFSCNEEIDGPARDLPVPRPALRQATRRSEPGGLDSAPGRIARQETATPDTMAKPHRGEHVETVQISPRETVHTTHHTVATHTRSVLERVVEQAPPPRLTAAILPQPHAQGTMGTIRASSDQRPDARPAVPTPLTAAQSRPAAAQRSKVEREVTAPLTAAAQRQTRAGALHPQPAPQRRAGRRTEPVTPTSPSAPAVHVTIGRIEVRAVPEGVGPRKSAQRQRPALGLEDYLRSRAGGGR